MKVVSILIAALAACSVPAVASAAVFIVTKTTDSNDGACDADCSLREALAGADSLASNDTVRFDPQVFAIPRTILVTSEIVIAGNGAVEVLGPAALLTLSGGGVTRILTNAVGAVTRIQGMRFTEGNGTGAANSGRGGAIYNTGGTLTLQDLQLVSNRAANGGALNNATAGTLLVERCLFADNTSASSGAALQNFSTSTLTVRDSSIVGNTSLSFEIIAAAAQVNGFATFVNTTISGNAAPDGEGGGVHSNGPSILLVNVTITDNESLTQGGGLHRTMPTGLSLRNTIIAGNRGAVESPDISAPPKGVQSLGHNLVGEVGATTGWVASDVLGQPAQLFALEAVGATLVHVPSEDSAAVDAGDDCVLDDSCAQGALGFSLVADQRAVQRPQGLHVDIGAVELAAADLPLFADGFELP